MMKRFYYGAMATGLLFTACSSDNLNEPDNNGPADADKTLYIKMSVHGDELNGTRAGNAGNPEAETDFEVGTDESEVNNAYFVFYDEKGNMVGDIVQIKLENPQNGANGTTVDKYYQNVIPVSIRKGELDPAQVICYINPVTPSGMQNKLNLIQTETRDRVYNDINGKKYFSMSNSVYYDGASATAPVTATQVIKTQLYETEAEAKADNAEAVDVYVERYASKLKFTGKDAKAYETFTTNTDGDEVAVSLTFVADKWALNAEANKTYIIKSFRKPGVNGDILADNYTYAEANTALNGKLTGSNAWTWNNDGYHRSYWACSPAYFTAKYPEVASDVASLTLNQTYYSYKDVTTDANIGYEVETVNPTPRYFKETTVGTRALDAGNPAAAVPSVILVGHYKMTVGGTEAPANTSFYTYIPSSNGNPLVFFEAGNDGISSAVAGGESMLKRFLDQTTVLFKKDGDNFVQMNTINDQALMVANLGIAKLDADSKVLEPGGTVEATPENTLKVPARQRTLQFKSDASLQGVYIASGNGYKLVVADNAENFNDATQIKVTDANRILMQQVGFANFYTSGHAYFNIPVRHYGWYRPGNNNGTSTSNKIDWGKVMVGDYGMVRNHSYTIEVNNIIGLATGIGGDDDPIVPPADTKDYYVAYKVNILKWAVVPTQGVDL